MVGSTDSDGHDRLGGVRDVTIFEGNTGLDPTMQKGTPILLSLPPELRIRIYNFVLPASSAITVPDAAQVPRPALLRTSHQIANEASNIYYSTNTFHATIISGQEFNLVRWLFVLGQHKVRTMTKLGNTCEMSPAFKRKCEQYDKGVGVMSLNRLWFNNHWEIFAKCLLTTGLRFDALYTGTLKYKTCYSEVHKLFQEQMEDTMVLAVFRVSVDH